MMMNDNCETEPVAERRHEMTCGNSRGPSGGIQQFVNGFVRRIEFEPGYDCMTALGEEAGRRCHGRHGMNVRFLLIGEEGAVQFLMYASDWLPGSIEHGHTRRDLPLMGAMAADLGHHWLRPVYEGEESHGSKCEYLADAPCFYDGSGLNADPLLVAFFDSGPDAVWEYLTAYWFECSESAHKTAAEAS